YLMDAPDLPNVRGIKFAEYNRYFRKQAPLLKTAALMPNTSLSLKPGIIYDFIRRSSLLRRAQDFEWLDENMIEDGLADRFSAIVLLAGQTYEQATLDRLEAWVKNGGVLFASNDTLPLVNVEGKNCAWLRKSPRPFTPGVPEKYAAETAKKEGRDAEAALPGAGEIDEKALLSAASHFGEGWTVVFPEGGPLYIGLVSACLYAENAPWSGRCRLVNAGEPHPACLAARRIDGEFDEVISSVIRTGEGKKVYYMNNSFEDVYKALPGGRELLIRARSIAEADLEEACGKQEFGYTPYEDPFGLPNAPDHRLDYACGDVKDYALVWEPDKEGSDWVILLHGHGSGADQPYTRPDIAEHWLPALKGKYGIVSFDTMGNGWMNPECAANMHNMLLWLGKRFGTGKFAVIGGSMGGTGALSYACQYPQDIGGVAALCACSDIASYTEFLRQAAAKAPGGVEQDILNAILAGFDDDPVKYEAASPLAYSERLTMPVFISHSTGDALIPVANSQRLAKKLAGKADFEYLEIEGGHHDTTLMPGFDRGLEFLAGQGVLKTPGLRQFTDSLKSDNGTLDKAFDIALNDIWCNIRPYKGFDACLCAGFDYPTPWTRDTAINTRNAGYLYPSVVRNNLFSMTETDDDGRVLTDSIERPECSGNYWDCIIWTLGLWYCYLYTGDVSLLREGYPVVKRTLEAYRKLEFNPEWGLFMGGGVYADGISAYPDHYREKEGKNPGIAFWAKRNPEFAFKGTASGDPMACLSTNCVYYEAYVLAAKMSDILGAGEKEKWLGYAEELKKSVVKAFRNEKTGSFDYLRDHMGNCERQEALGIAFLVLADMLPENEAGRIFDNLVSTPWGVACVEPAFGRYKPDPDTFGRHCGTVWPFCSMFVAEAAAKAGRGDVFSREARLLAEMATRHDGFYEIYHPLTGEPYGGMQEPDTDKATWRSVPRQTWSATGFVRAVLAGVFGVWFDEKGVYIRPAEQTLCTRASLDIPARDMTLCLRYKKTGKARTAVDGAETAFIPWEKKGKALVEIEN
ncbi:MAG: alpha/beta fold hydrolase, partial [Abditibacteriota bacterium]|nr:alpha/beta fold hydrolase [Abditibacteriota bacterium]